MSTLGTAIVEILEANEVLEQMLENDAPVVDLMSAELAKRMME